MRIDRERFDKYVLKNCSSGFNVCFCQSIVLYYYVGEDKRIIFRCTICRVFEVRDTFQVKRHAVSCIRTQQRRAARVDKFKQTVLEGSKANQWEAFLASNTYACQVCDYKCNTKSHLKRHLLTHLKGKALTQTASTFYKNKSSSTSSRTQKSNKIVNKSKSSKPRNKRK